MKTKWTAGESEIVGLETARRLGLPVLIARYWIHKETAEEFWFRHPDGSLTIEVR